MQNRGALANHDHCVHIKTHLNGRVASAFCEYIFHYTAFSFVKCFSLLVYRLYLTIAVTIIRSEDACGDALLPGTQRPACNLMGKQRLAAVRYLHSILITLL